MRKLRRPKIDLKKNTLKFSGLFINFTMIKETKLSAKSTFTDKYARV